MIPMLTGPPIFLRPAFNLWVFSSLLPIKTTLPFIQKYRVTIWLAISGRKMPVAKQILHKFTASTLL
jgi:hypothetical protein